MTRGSGPKAPSPHRKRSRLSPEEEALWDRLAQTIEPLRSVKSRVPEVGADASAVPQFGAARSAATRRRHQEATPTPATATLPRRSETPTTAAAPLPDLDRKRVRRISTGRIEIDARLDLHGLRQSEAHHRLVGFLHACAADGRSHVLIITGKGGQRLSSQTSLVDSLEVRDRGVLRRSVPLWLEEPGLRSLVVGFRPAGPRHGGDGALYVQLRKRAGGGR